jgi:hypothetical protein
MTAFKEASISPGLDIDRAAATSAELGKEWRIFRDLGVLEVGSVIVLKWPLDRQSGHQGIPMIKSATGLAAERPQRLPAAACGSH